MYETDIFLPLQCLLKQIFLSEFGYPRPTIILPNFRKRGSEVFKNTRTHCNYLGNKAVEKMVFDFDKTEIVKNFGIYISMKKLDH